MITTVAAAAVHTSLPKMRRAADIVTTPNRHRPALPNDGRKIQPPTPETTRVFYESLGMR